MNPNPIGSWLKFGNIPNANWAVIVFFSPNILCALQAM
jgi:hypothetical protein